MKSEKRISDNCLDNIAAPGESQRFKLDVVTASALHRVQSIFRMNAGEWIKKDYLVRRAIRHYLQHLKRTDSVLDEVEQLTKAIEGRI